MKETAAVWETSSALVALVLVAVVAWFTRRWPLRLDNWRHMLPAYVAASVAWSALHVAGMVLLAKVDVAEGQRVAQEPA